MARVPKPLEPLDLEIADVLNEAVGQSGMSRRELALQLGMSMNRIGIILRKEPPPATVGEVGLLASIAGLSASQVIATAEERLAAKAGTRALRLVPDQIEHSFEVDGLVTLNPAASDADDVDPDAEVEAQQSEP
ncbi:hypothetical protein [Cellulomonas palmilytica]|uniref:hypothetical protein n=1 Tax=Cellulomonas palmilytica TaxID=2608402 RepID=UPI001F258881|nr:hypothetical protein [Cellulomonas palmilytica]UJP39364.1 hypothetical protein F1D97_13615 [Cellulomonas palmilytica]